MSSSKTVDHLEDDFIQIPGQAFALISVVSPSSSQQHATCALKIRGVFSNKEDAEHHVKRLMQADSTFDVFMVELYKWLPIPPNVEMIENKVYQEEMLNSIIQGHKEEQLRAKQHFEERKRDLETVVEAEPTDASEEPTDPDAESVDAVEKPTDQAQN